MLVRWCLYIDGQVQERRNSSALAMELRVSCTHPSILRGPPDGNGFEYTGNIKATKKCCLQIGSHSFQRSMY